MGKSNISYLSHVWNVLTGCSGKGCTADCYARRFVKARPAMHGYEETYECGGLRKVPIPFEFVRFHPDRLSEPLKRNKPTVWGVGFFGDMFDEQVKFEWLKSILFKMYGRGRHHTYVLLTKHPDRMAQFFADQSHKGGLWETPLDNVWLGTTVNTQAEADERIPELLKVPGKKWISIEPMLGPIDLTGLHDASWRGCNEKATSRYDSLSGKVWFDGTGRNGFAPTYGKGPTIDLVVVGGESGPKARPMHPDWARSIRDQCAAAGVPFYFKQWGEWQPITIDNRHGGEPFSLPRRRQCFVNPDGTYVDEYMKGGKDYCWPMIRVGLKAAGRLLDGVLHDDLPWRQP